MPLAPKRLDEPFDPGRFHFGKIDPKEILLVYSDHAERQRCTSRVMTNRGADTPQEGHPVLLNPFPLGPRSGLLTPWLGLYRSQLMTLGALRVGLAFARHLHSSGIKIGYNSLGAGASVNHFHFQTWQPGNPLPVEMAELEDFNIEVTFGNSTRVVRVAPSTEIAPVSYLRWTLESSVGGVGVFVVQLGEDH